jgi:cytoskeletal protein CcmA (bactofilin family)
MFKSKNPPSNPTVTNMQPIAAAPRPVPKPVPKASGVPSIISAEMTIRGDLKSPGDLQIEGAVMGEIEVGKLVIAEGGRVEGNITAQNVKICGALHGSVRASMVTLTATARVIGDIHHELLAIETGGQLEGMARRIQADTPRPMAEIEHEPVHDEVEPYQSSTV